MRAITTVCDESTDNASEEQIALPGSLGSFVVLLDPFRIAVLQHVRNPHSLRGRVGARQFIAKTEAVRSSRPTVPAFQPNPIDLLRSKGSFDPSGPDQLCLLGKLHHPGIRNQHKLEKLSSAAVRLGGFPLRLLVFLHCFPLFFR